MASTTVAFAMKIDTITLVKMITTPDEVPGVVRKPSSIRALTVDAWFFEKKSMIEGVLLYRAKNNPKAWILYVEQPGELPKEGLNALFPSRKALFRHSEQYVTPSTYYLITSGPLKGSYLWHREYVGEGQISYSIESAEFEAEEIKAIEADKEAVLHGTPLNDFFRLHYYLTTKTEFCRMKTVRCL